ncbi:hypothetical protein CEXT_198961 [Caerostris extrusa]|uniref:Uncharacterized protein n=1 Tax=Caerostris extrusa TaxID=172846 RepID=A0AAV4WU35_CAEEX|nr:hypothetical protein CEXT_198961 [Caerostris extrusa]
MVLTYKSEIMSHRKGRYLEKDEGRSIYISISHVSSEKVDSQKKKRAKEKRLHERRFFFSDRHSFTLQTTRIPVRLARVSPEHQEKESGREKADEPHVGIRHETEKKKGRIAYSVCLFKNLSQIDVTADEYTELE